MTLQADEPVLFLDSNQEADEDIESLLTALVETKPPHEEVSSDETPDVFQFLCRMNETLRGMKVKRAIMNAETGEVTVVINTRQSNRT